MALEDSLLEPEDGKSMLGLNEFDTTDALRLDIINCQNTVWLGDNVSSISIYIFRTMIIVIYLMISIAVCIIITVVQFEDTALESVIENIIHGIISRYETVVVASDIDQAGIGTAYAYGWMTIMQFEWIAFVVILLWLFEADIQDDWILDTRFKWIVIVAGILLTFCGLFKDTIEYYWQFDDITIYIEDIILYAIYVLKFINNGFIIYIFDVGWIRKSKDEQFVQGSDFVVQNDSVNDMPLRKQQMVKQQQQSVPQYLQDKKCANSQVNNIVKNVFENKIIMNKNGNDRKRYEDKYDNNDVYNHDNYGSDCNDNGYVHSGYHDEYDCDKYNDDCDNDALDINYYKIVDDKDDIKTFDKGGKIIVGSDTPGIVSVICNMVDKNNKKFDSLMNFDVLGGGVPDTQDSIDVFDLLFNKNNNKSEICCNNDSIDDNNACIDSSNNKNDSLVSLRMLGSDTPETNDGIISMVCINIVFEKDTFVFKIGILNIENDGNILGFCYIESQ